MVHWDILLTALAASMPVLVAAVATYIQGHAAKSTLERVQKQTNGIQSHLASRVAAVEDQQAAPGKGAP